MEAIAEKGVRVASGTFRVSREEALRKLKQFQLKDPARFLLSWVRVASVCEATNVAVLSAGDGISFRFDGRPLPARLLEDPLGGLFGDAAEEEAARHFGAGYLGAWRCEPQSVDIETGFGSERKHLRASPDWSLEALAPDPTESATVLTVRWARLAPLPLLAACLGAVRNGCALQSQTVTVQDQPVPDRPDDSFLVTLRGGRRGWLRRRSRRDGFLDPEGTVRVSCRGTLLEPVRGGGVFKLVDGCLADDNLLLDLSQQSAVNNDWLLEGLKLLDEAADKWLVRELKVHTRDFTAAVTRAVADGGFWSDWGRAFAGNETERSLAETVERLEWLREALVHDAQSHPSPWSAAVRKRLHKAPVLAGAFGSVISRRRVGKLRGRWGSLDYSTRALRPVEYPWREEPLLLLSKADESFLSRLFRHPRFKDVTPGRFAYWVRRFLRRD